MPDGDERGDFGYGPLLPPEVDPPRGRRSGGKDRLTVGDLQSRNSDTSSRGRHRAGGGAATPRRHGDETRVSPANRHGGGAGGPGGPEWPPPGPPRPPRAAHANGGIGGWGGNGGAWRKGSLLGARVVIALVSVAALIGSGIAWATYRQFTAGIQHGVALPKVAKGKKDVDGKDQNILLLGNDSIAGATKDEVNALGTTTDRNDSATDTMMILHVPADGSTASIISFPRDSWVMIPGHGMGKINGAYVDGFNDAANQGAKDMLSKQSAGITLAAQTLTNLTGLHIDHYVQVNLLGFFEISKAIGGVNLCLNEDAKDPYSAINLHKGWNKNVEGKQALAFVRQRHGFPDGLGDIDRIKRQQYFLSAVFHKAVSGGTLLNFGKLRSLLNAVKKSLITDPSLDIIQFVQQFSKIAGGNISFGTPPWQFGQVDGTSVVLVDPAAVKQFVNKVIGVPVDKKLATARPVPPTQVSVVVLNQSNQDLVATKNASILGQAGFLATVGNTDQHTDQTSIEYPDGMQAQAKTLAKYVPKALIEQSSTVSKLTLILGSDGLGAKSAPAAAPKTTTTKAGTPKATPSPKPSGVTNAAQNSKSCID